MAHRRIIRRYHSIDRFSTKCRGPVKVLFRKPAARNASQFEITRSLLHCPQNRKAFRRQSSLQRPTSKRFAAVNGLKMFFPLVSGAV